MKCLICKKEIHKKLVWKSLFLNDTNLRCDKCSSKYLISLNTKIYELSNGIIDVYRLFSKKYHINALAFSYELGELINLLYKRYEMQNGDTIIIYYDDSLEIFNNYKYIDKLFNLVDKIVVFTLH